MISDVEKARMMRAHSIGPRMVSYLEMIGIERLEDLRDADAAELAFRINAELGRRHINAAGIKALENLIVLARKTR